MCPMDLKIQHNPHNRNVTFDRAFQDGIEYGTYPYETDLYSNMRMEFPNNMAYPYRKYDPENPRRVLTAKQKRRW